MILVTGATGNVGSQVVRDLRERGVEVRAFVRDPQAAAERLPAGVEVVRGDFEDEGSVRRAVEGVDAVLLSSADGPSKVEQETRVIDAAAEAGVGRIVKISTVRAEAGSPLPPFDWHGRIEEHLGRSGIPSVVLQSNFYMTNLFAAAEQVRHAGRIFAPAGDGKVSTIDPRDTGSVAAAILAGDGHEGRTYVLTGPEAITYEHIARELSAATGRSVAFVDVPEAAAGEALVEAGLPDWLVTHLRRLFGLIRGGALAEVTGTVRALTGREPRPFAAFARDHADVFGG